jgi:hypothetical protein
MDFHLIFSETALKTTIYCLLALIVALRKRK